MQKGELDSSVRSAHLQVDIMLVQEGDLLYQACASLADKGKAAREEFQIEFYEIRLCGLKSQHRKLLQV